jgi:hypothetical protein
MAEIGKMIIDKLQGGHVNSEHAALLKAPAALKYVGRTSACTACGMLMA